jgi:hypothetical protein
MEGGRKPRRSLLREAVVGEAEMADGARDRLLHIADHGGECRAADVYVAQMRIACLLRELQAETERGIERTGDGRAMGLVEVSLSIVLSFSTTTGALAAKMAEASVAELSTSEERSMIVSSMLRHKNDRDSAHAVSESGSFWIDVDFRHVESRISL